jgi:hypothetical protein
MTLTQLKSEVPMLIQKIKEGKIDGSKYEGDCACLKGTLANSKGVSYKTTQPNSNDPSEQWFMMIREGDKPGDISGGGFASGKALEWILEWCEFHGYPTEIAPPIITHSHALPPFGELK